MKNIVLYCLIDEKKGLKKLSQSVWCTENFFVVKSYSTNTQCLVQYCVLVGVLNKQITQENELPSR